MFIAKRHLPRRTFLRGMGATVALPLLESMAPAATPLHAAAPAPTRFTGIFVPHGAAPGFWIPDAVGRDFAYPYIWEPLERFRNQVVITSGLWSRSAESPPGVTGADHFVAAAYLCAEKPKKTTGADIDAGTTIDQRIARRVGQDTLLPLLQLAGEDPGANSNNCGEGYSCAYTNSISWQTPTRPLPMEINPQVVFERMFGDGSTAEERFRRRERQRSILDSVTESLARLRVDVGAGDRIRLDQYLTDVREIERRLEIAARASIEIPDVAVPYGVPGSFDEHIKLAVRPSGAGVSGGHHPRLDASLRPRPHRPRLSRERHQRELSRGVAPRRRAEPGTGVRQAQPLSRRDAGVSRREAAVDSRRRRHAAGPHGRALRFQHGELESASALRRPARADRRRLGAARRGRHLAYPQRSVTTGNLLLSIMDMFDVHHDRIDDSTGRLVGL